jgi:hypothetical protein
VDTRLQEQEEHNEVQAVSGENSIMDTSEPLRISEMWVKYQNSTAVSSALLLAFYGDDPATGMEIHKVGMYRFGASREDPK